LDELNTLSNRFPDPFYVDDETKNKCMEDLQYWKGKDLRSLYDRAIEETAPESLNIYGHGIGGPNVESFSHMHLGYDTLIRKGMSGLIKDIEERKAALDIGDPDFVKKMSFYNSCLIVCDAYKIFAERYAAHAEKLAAAEEDEAIQMIWFAQILAIIESGLRGAFGQTGDLTES
jgi:formate C-acetyltransferase